jgi:uncharacterized membrane protein
MEGVLTIALLWLLFGGSHIGLAAAPVRERVVAIVGRRGFPWVYTLFASLSFTALVVAYAGVQAVGPRGLDLASVAWGRAVLTGITAVGVVLMTAAFAPAGYWGSPIAVLMEGVRPPWGLERITRHPFFTGLVLVAGAHALLATHLTGTVFFAGFVALSVLGSVHQSGKLRARHGEAFDRYLATTSAIPFLAIARGDQHLVLRELPWAWMLAGVGVVLALQRLHAGIMAYHGAPFIIAVVGGSTLIGVIAARHDRTRARAHAHAVRAAGT